MYTSSSALLSYSNILLSINFKKYIDNYYFKILQLRVGLPTSIIYTFGVWVQNINHGKRKLLFIGIRTMLWAI
jgi:hypothetical protein